MSEQDAFRCYSNSRSDQLAEACVGRLERSGTGMNWGTCSIYAALRFTIVNRSNHLLIDDLNRIDTFQQFRVRG